MGARVARSKASRVGLFSVLRLTTLDRLLVELQPRIQNLPCERGLHCCQRVQIAGVERQAGIAGTGDIGCVAARRLHSPVHRLNLATRAP